MTYEQILEFMRTATESLNNINNPSDGEIAAIYNAHWLFHVAIKAMAFQNQLPQADRMHCAETAQMMALESFDEIKLSINKCEKCGKETTEKLIEVDKEDFDVRFWNGNAWVKSEFKQIVRKICSQCCRG